MTVGETVLGMTVGETVLGITVEKTVLEMTGLIPCTETYGFPNMFLFFFSISKKMHIVNGEFIYNSANPMIFSG